MENSNRGANCSYNHLPPREDPMIRTSKPSALVLTTLLAAAAQGAAQQIENELVLITPVARTLTDPALAEFAKYAKEKWNVNVKTRALAAGTPVAYGRIVEPKGRPAAHIVRRRKWLGVAQAPRRQHRHLHRAQPRRARGRREG